MRLKVSITVIAFLSLFVLLSESQSKDIVKFVSSWVIYPPDAAFFAARDKGFYSEAGLDVRIDRGYGSGNTIKAVGVKSYNFGFADAAALSTARARGTKVKEIAVLYSRAPHAMVTLKGSGIRKAKDVEGRRYADTKGSSNDSSWPGFARMAGINVAKVKTIYMDAAARLPSLLAGRVDAYATYATEFPIVAAKAKEHNKEARLLLWADSGFAIYSNGIIAHDDEISQRPDLVRRYLKATLKGWAYGVDHPGEVVDLFLKTQPMFEKKLAIGQWKIAVNLSASPEAKKHGIGYILHKKIKATRDLIFEAMNVKGNVKVEDLYTNRFNPKLIPQAWK